MSYIDRNTSMYNNKKEITILDPTKTQFLNLSDELYDKDRGWRLMPVAATPTLRPDEVTEP